jgi:hypothetical protein
MRVIAKKRCRAVVEPPEKGERATLNPNLSRKLNLFFSDQALGRRVGTANSASGVSSVIYHQARQRNFPISSVVVDAFGGQTLAGLNYFHRLDDSILH